MSKVLVTGSSGFIGQALVKRLAGSGHLVYEFDLPGGDVTLPDAFDHYTKHGVDHIFHLAGKTFVPESWEHPAEFFRVNVMGTIQVLELCRKTGAGLTYISSYLYGEPDYLPIDELHPVKSYNPYSQSKVIADSTCQFYARHYKLPLTIFRPFNAYGPGQSPRFLIPEIIAKVMDPKIPAVEVMDLRPRRDYLFIDDLLDALIISIGKPHGIYNLGSGCSISVEEVIRLVLKHTGINKPFHSLAKPRPNEIYDLYSDIGKARRELGWSPGTSFDSGIEKCISASQPVRKPFSA